ncbi:MULTISPECIES: NAD(P)-binding protein [unclassified Haladaptatus]|uniref:potassium channel family protein n=1 Tax=unclassified Haladaptatus TaxID=2622732 RepID=UPI00209BBC63|nr:MULTISPECIES: NAD(P)-binding protein [unclassified Haladaptatus]MCO8243272.1 NAD-binding protein [Haladaptatus sp. AB643]MCO8252983.1 NAD-binding protein [Haladaptatus sp. AB618]
MTSVPLPLGAFIRRTLVRRLLRPVAAFVFLVVAGVVGFSTVHGVGVVDALFWLIDPTSIELHFQTHEGPATLVKAYAIVIFTGLVVVGLWIGETFVSAAFGGQIHEELRHMQIQHEIENLENHVVICGYGTFGKTIAAQLDESGRDVVVIETKETGHRKAIDDGFLAVEGDARHEQVLADAGVSRAETVIGAIDDSNVNIQIIIATTQLAPGAKLIVRAGDATYESLARQAGADEVIIPEVVSGEQVSMALSHPQRAERRVS